MGFFDNKNNDNSATNLQKPEIGTKIKAEHVSAVYEKLNDIGTIVCSTSLIIGIIICLIAGRQFQEPLSIFNFLTALIPFKLGITITVFGLIVLAIILIVSKVFFSGPDYDYWLPDVAQRRISTDKIFYDKKNLYCTYDIMLNIKELKDFVTEMSDRSTTFTYYFNWSDINQQLLCLTPVRKESIPERCTLDRDKDTAWNVVPLGLTVNDKLKKVSEIGWWLNDEDKSRMDEMYVTQVSNSILVAGGTGSGKSVTENCIIGHFSRFSDRYQMILLDPKQVEFGNLDIVKGVVSVAVEIQDIADIFTMVDDAMVDQYRQMKANGVNGIYKLEGKELPAYKINGYEYSTDDIIKVRIDGKEQIMLASILKKEFDNRFEEKKEERPMRMRGGMF